jgi:hypothetical protein
MSAMKELIELSIERNRQKYPNFPDNFRPRPKYTDKTANGLTKCIIDFLNFKGHQAERIATSGRWLDQREIVTNVVGISKTIGTGKWIPGSGTKGSADISATLKGRSVKIEVKIGNDRQSEDQKAYQQHIESAGGVYIIAKDFETFYGWYKSFVV